MPIRSLRPLPALVAAALVATTLTGAGTPRAEDGGATGTPPPAGTVQPGRVAGGWFYTSVPQHVLDRASTYSDVSPFWYEVRAEAGLPVIRVKAAAANLDRPAEISRIRAAGIKVVPAVTEAITRSTSNEQDLLTFVKMLESPTIRAQHVQDLATFATDAGFDGLDLDYEGFAWSATKAPHPEPQVSIRKYWDRIKPAWTTFVTELAAELHRRGKVLYATVPTPLDYTGTKPGYWVYNHAEIAKVVDRLRIMAYDRSTSGGPNAPLSWVQAILDYLGPLVPREKLVLGVPNYGRVAGAYTKDANDRNVWVVPASCPVGTATGRVLALTTAVADALTVGGPFAVGAAAADVVSTRVTALTRGSELVDGERTLSLTVQYTGKTADGAATSCTITRSGYYDDAASTQAKLRLMEARELLGVAFWHLGGGNDAVWAKVQESSARRIAAAPKLTISANRTVNVGTPVATYARLTASGLPMAGQQVVVYAKNHGWKTWIKVGTAGTDANGYAAASRTVTRHLDIRMVSVAESIFVPATSPTRTVWARATSTLRSPVASTPVNRSITLTGTTTPARPGATAYLYRLSNGKWIRVLSAKQTSKGTVAFRFTPSPRGTRYYRMVVPATSSTFTGTSSTLKLVIR